MTELFNGAFEDDVDGLSGISETWFKITLNDLPAGVVVDWPDSGYVNG